MEDAPRLGCVDASVCIALETINQLSLLPTLFSTVLLPEGVLIELMQGRNLDGAWLVIREKRVEIVRTRDIATPDLPSVLHRGEREVIALAAQRHGVALLDDGKARRTARALGLSVYGTVALLLAGKHRGYIGEVRPYLEQLQDHGFRLDGRLIVRALELAGE
jgi:predicted nucleic acid-binding protein